MAKPELGTKRLCPNCGAKYYDLNRDPIMCPKCNASFATGIIATRRETARPADDEDEELEADDEGVELVALEEAEDDADDTADSLGVDDDDDVTVDTDDDVLVDDEDSDDEVSDVVRGSGEDDDEH
ncbi:TIGR02300 family protein [Acuticoccus sp. I52.16.1]|uniref:TIGR02300 family protein n=1 Tax=Acuticoccus sp. I52.16.1 TaxID=2928472 RepID=UPI001FD331A4|nr:TIGR02300 family protein [Acuticoccus sp. I52.16.1]UOM33529.1 TIGR02300 family protein [Acuticoccus sp. I52.16.1]